MDSYLCAQSDKCLLRFNIQESTSVSQLESKLWFCIATHLTGTGKIHIFTSIVYASMVCIERKIHQPMHFSGTFQSSRLETETTAATPASLSYCWAFGMPRIPRSQELQKSSFYCATDSETARDVKVEESTSVNVSYTSSHEGNIK
jgi:hypothetical protein